VHLSQLGRQYRQFIQEAKRRFKRLKALPTLDEELKEKALDLLAKLTELKYLEIYRQDPMLPRAFVPSEWPGFRAYRIYQLLDKYLR